MTLTLPTTSIRPLGEEHLRMFRRMTEGEGAPAPRITMPKSAKEHKHVFLSNEKVDFQPALELPEKYGGRLASATEALMDGSFIKRAKGAWVCVNPEGMPSKRGWYRIDIRSRSLKPIMEREANKLEWNEIVYAYKSAVDEGKRGIAITLRVATGPGHHRKRIELLGDMGYWDAGFGLFHAAWCD